MEQRIAVLVSLVLGVLVIAVFAYIARTASVTGNADEIAASSARWRRTALLGLLLLFIPAIGFSLTKMPYSSGDTPPDVVVEATGNQWAWKISAPPIAVGQRVEIRVTAADVNHGFGVYDGKNRLITQTQAMPGYTNVIRHTFTEVGTYRILCLEYCGLGHHTMFGELVVNARGAQ
jgi:cytochrome c oxidase subunit II